MADLKTLIEREIDRAGEPAFTLDNLDDLRVRRHRTRRVTAAVVGLGIGVALILALVGASIYRSAPTPADLPEQPPVNLGIFEQIAGRIVYFENGSLWGVDPNAGSSSSTLVRLNLGRVEDVDRFASFTMPLGWSSDGTELLFVREDPTDDTFPYDRHLFILHADGTETQVTPDPVGSAAISPDGSRVVFADDKTDGLFVVDADGGQPVRITDGEEPTFSPDGTRIAYLGLPRSGCCVETGREHVWVANADGSDGHEILVDEPALARGADSLTWSPAGDRIAMAGYDGNHEAIYTFSPDGSAFTMVIPSGTHPHWSPDGSQIAYELLSPGPYGVRIVDADGSNPRSLGVGKSGPWHPGTLEEDAEATASQSPSTSPTPSPSTSALPTPSALPSPLPGSSTFTSTMHGISIVHPSDWQVRPATEPWDHDSFTFDAPGVDVIFDPALQDDLYLSLASWPLDGQSAEDWFWAGDQVCETGGNYGRFTVDGEEASQRGCDGDANRFEDMVVQVATATHFYVIYLHVADDPDLQDTYTEGWFAAAIDTVELR